MKVKQTKKNLIVAMNKDDSIKTDGSNLDEILSMARKQGVSDSNLDKMDKIMYEIMPIIKEDVIKVREIWVTRLQSFKLPEKVVSLESKEADEANMQIHIILNYLANFMATSLNDFLNGLFAKDSPLYEHKSFIFKAIDIAIKSAKEKIKEQEQE